MNNLSISQFLIQVIGAYRQHNFFAIPHMEHTITGGGKVYTEISGDYQTNPYNSALKITIQEEDDSHGFVINYSSGGLVSIHCNANGNNFSASNGEQIADNLYNATINNLAAMRKNTSDQTVHWCSLIAGIATEQFMAKAA